MNETNQNQMYQQPYVHFQKPWVKPYKLTGLSKAGLIMQIIVSSMISICGIAGLATIMAFIISALIHNTPLAALSFTIPGIGLISFDSITIWFLPIILLLVSFFFILTFSFSVHALRKKTRSHKNTTVAGVFGLIFTGIFFGVLTLAGNEK